VSTGNGDDLVGESVTRSLWAFPGVDLGVRPTVAQRAVAERILLGWAAPSDALAREVNPGTVDAQLIVGLAVERRREFLTGRAILGRLLESLFPGSVAWAVDAASEDGTVVVRGVPALASVAYADGMVVAMAAATSQASRIGVELERNDPVRAASVAKELGVPVDGALRRWVHVQAVLRAGRHGRRADPGLVRIGAGTGRVEGSSTDYRIAEVEGPSGYAAGVAWRPAGRA